jgi:SAM-dependent methyltransferase
MNQQKIWDYFQTTGVESFTRSGARLRFVADQVGSGARVLNIGVGNGSLEAFLSRKKAQVWSLDPSEKAIARLREMGSIGDRAKVGVSQSLPFESEMFDVVVMSDVLEHLEQQSLDGTLIEVKRVLRPGGEFIGTVPADEDFVGSMVVCPDCGSVFHRWGHVQVFSRTTVFSLLSAQFVDIRVVRKYFPDWKSLNWKGRIGSTIKRCMLWSGVKGSDEQFYFSARKS